ncbi:MAG: SPASM domain-containing protein [Candidatus Anstonellales archaeon]
MVVTKENVHMIPEMMQFVRDEGVDYMEYQPVSLTEDHRLYDSLDFTTSKESTDEFIAQIQMVKRYQGLTVPSEIYQQILHEVLVNKTITVTNCFGGKSLFFVDPLGDIWPCPSRRRKQEEDNLGNIMTSSLEDLQRLLTLSGQDGLGQACSKCDRDCACMFELTTSNIWQK